jgi:hypothetical protein
MKWNTVLAHEQGDWEDVAEAAARRGLHGGALRPLYAATVP